MDIRPDHANLMKNGDIVKVDPDEVMVGDNIVIMPGDRIPLMLWWLRNVHGRYICHYW